MLHTFGIFLLCASSCIAVFPSDIERCKEGDTGCIVTRANEFVRKFANGRPDLGFPTIDPFKVKTFTIGESSQQQVNLNLLLTDVEMRGLSQQTFQKAVGFLKDVANSKYEIYGTIPKLVITGKYKIDGRILLLPIQGDGEVTLTLERIKGGLKFKPIPYEKNGHQHLKIQKFKLLLDPENLKVKLTNLFNGNKELGESLNDVINTNWRDAWQELSPPIIESVQNIIKDAFQQFLDKNEYDTFYLPE